MIGDPRKILFRVDGNAQIGCGHIIRCVALAQRLKQEGYQIHFLSSVGWREYENYLISQGFFLKIIPLAPGKLGGEEDLAILLQEIQHGFDWVVLDNYYYGIDYQRAVRQIGVLLLVIDDTAEHEIDADVVLNHGLQATRLKYQFLSMPRTALGSQYAIIRREVIERRQKKEKGSKNLLVTLGGGEHDDVYSKILSAVLKIQNHTIHVRVLGNFDPLAREGCSNLYAGHASVTLEFVKPIMNIWDLYNWADLAICAGGGTSWELCFYGVVGLVGILAENQRLIVESLQRHGLFKSVGVYRGSTPQIIAGALQELLDCPAQIEMMRSRATKLIDGKGVDRVCQIMQEVASEKYQNR